MGNSMIPPLVAVVHWMESNRGPCRREGRPTAQTRPLEPLGQPAAQAQKGSPEVSTRQPIGRTI